MKSIQQRPPVQTRCMGVGVWGKGMGGGSWVGGGVGGLEMGGCFGCMMVESPQFVFR